VHAVVLVLEVLAVEAAEQQDDVEEDVVGADEGPPDFDQGPARVEGEGAVGERGQVVRH